MLPRGVVQPPWSSSFVKLPPCDSFALFPSNSSRGGESGTVVVAVSVGLAAVVALNSDVVVVFMEAFVMGPATAIVAVAEVIMEVLQNEALDMALFPSLLPVLAPMHGTTGNLPF